MPVPQERQDHHSQAPLTWQPYPLGQRIYVALQYLLPHHLISALVYHATRWRWRPWKDFLIQTISNHFKIDLGEALDADSEAFGNFNEFFTRRLKPDARPIADDTASVACPADGTISQIGSIKKGRIFQAKGQSFTALELLGGDQQLARMFEEGLFATIYLSPRDYHRVHMPAAGRLLRDIYVPGRLFSVAPLTVRKIPRLFARNERIACIFQTTFGPLAQVLVGAINVSAMETLWQGEVPSSRGIRQRNYAGDANQIMLERGAEMGRFNMGSTVIVLFPRDALQWCQDIGAGKTVRMGQEIGRLTEPD
jgi:phosphatidylserine decarboxylase